MRELADLVALPNLAADSAAIRRNADHLIAALERRSVRARLLELAGCPPAVLGEMPVAGAHRTAVLYAHYDGQPVDAAEWTSEPYRPVLRAGASAAAPAVALEALDGNAAAGEWRLWARSASDDKGPIVAMLAALDALRAGGIQPSVNLKFFFEGEEEAGSPNLEAMLRAHAAALAADVWLFCDGPVHPSRRPQLFFGVRGVVDVEMTVYGPARALHSGHYGNWAPNPAVMLVQLLASMRDDDGHVLVGGFYDGIAPLDEAQQRAVAASPAVEEELQRALALGRVEGEDQRLADRILLPGLNVRGIRAGGVREAAANAIPTHAYASIDFRLVPDQTPERVRALVEAHAVRQGWYVLDGEPDAEALRTHARVVRMEWGRGYPAMRTPMTLPAARAVTQVARAVDPDVVLLPSLGGSVPMHVFAQALAAPMVGVPIVNHDNNQHAADENLRLQNLWDGIELYAALMARLGSVWPESR